MLNPPKSSGFKFLSITATCEITEMGNQMIRTFGAICTGLAIM